MGDINLIFSFLMDLFGDMAALYTGSFLLASVIALWLFRRVINYFRYITG